MASVISRRLFSTSARRFQEHTQQELRKESRRNPEIMVRHNPRAPSANRVSLLCACPGVRDGRTD